MSCPLSSRSKKSNAELSRAVLPISILLPSPVVSVSSSAESENERTAAWLLTFALAFLSFLTHPLPWERCASSRSPSLPAAGLIREMARAFALLLLSAVFAGALARINVSKKVTVGVDYYPEQWPLSDMEEDMRSIKEDLGADIVRVGEFMWSILEPTSGQFNFTLLDRVLAEAEKQGLEVMLGTPTATMPWWVHKVCYRVLLPWLAAPGSRNVRALVPAYIIEGFYSTVNACRY